MTPAELLATARDLIDRPDATTAGVWPRTAALLARQALEAAVDAQWAATSSTAGMARAAMRSQLICLPSYADETVARRIAFTYAALSGACHFHPYELAPTAAELSGWITDVETLLTRLAPLPRHSASACSCLQRRGGGMSWETGSERIQELIDAGELGQVSPDGQLTRTGRVG